MRLLLDTNVLVAGFRSPAGASAALLAAARAGRVSILASLSVALEYLDVFGRPQTVAGTGLTLKDANTFVVAVIAMAASMVVRFRLRPQLADPDDEHVLEAAINGGADALVTFNVRDFQPAAQRLGLRTAIPAAILRELEKADA